MHHKKNCGSQFDENRKKKIQEKTAHSGYRWNRFISIAFETFQECRMRQAWWYMPIIQTLGRQKQEVCKFKTSLKYIDVSRPATNQDYIFCV